MRMCDLSSDVCSSDLRNSVNKRNLGTIPQVHICDLIAAVAQSTILADIKAHERPACCGREKPPPWLGFRTDPLHTSAAASCGKCRGRAFGNQAAHTP